MTNESTQMYIPTINDEVTLTREWTFSLYYEYRNEDMIVMIFPKVNFQWRGMEINGMKPDYGTKIVDVTLPAGSVLKVARIYIRNGKSEYDSVTFVLQSLPKTEIDVALERGYHTYGEEETDARGMKFRRENGFVSKKKHKKKVRFWAKLKDVNTMRFIMGNKKTEVEEQPLLKRKFRFDLQGGE